MKRKDIKELKEALDNIDASFSIQFLIFVEKNKSILEKEYNIIKNITDKLYLEKFKEYYQKKEEVKEDNKKIEYFNEEYVDTLILQEQRIKEYNMFLEETIEINLLKIDIDEFPEELTKDLDKLIFIVD